MFFLSGLPRSGSTLLAAILSQNPKVYVSITSPLLDFLGIIEQTWHQAYRSYTCPFPNHLEDISKGLVRGFYSSVEKPHVIDKSRGWAANIGKLQMLVDGPPKVICTVRDLPSVVASFYRLFDLQPKGESNIDLQLVAEGKVLNRANRCQCIWETLVRGPWNSFKAGFQQHPQSIHLVEYEVLLKKPQEVLEGIYRFLDIPSHEHRFDEITSPVIEDDNKWRIKDLHKIGKKLERQSADPATIIGEDLFKTYRDLRLEFWR